MMIVFIILRLSLILFIYVVIPRVSQLFIVTISSLLTKFDGVSLTHDANFFSVGSFEYV